MKNYQEVNSMLSVGEIQIGTAGRLGGGRDYIDGVGEGKKLCEVIPTRTITKRSRANVAPRG